MDIDNFLRKLHFGLSNILFDKLYNLKNCTIDTIMNMEDSFVNYLNKSQTRIKDKYLEQRLNRLYNLKYKANRSLDY